MTISNSDRLLEEPFDTQQHPSFPPQPPHASISRQSRQGSSSQSRSGSQSTRDASLSTLRDLPHTEAEEKVRGEVRPVDIETINQQPPSDQPLSSSPTSVPFSSNSPGPSVIPSSTDAGPSALPKIPRQPTTPSTRRKIPNIDTKVISRVSFDEPYTSSRSPNHTPTPESGITRRRFSITSNITSPRRSSHPCSNPASPRKHSNRAWLPSGPSNIAVLPPTINKSDDEREEASNDGSKQLHRLGKKNKWFEMTSAIHENEPPTINMTPPSTTSELVPVAISIPYSFIPSPLLSTLSLSPLPQDPHNILPLSVPCSPAPSPPVSMHNSPFHTPHPSLPDLQAEYAYSASSAGPSGSSDSPRTSTSTASSRAGINGYPLQSDSPSSQEEDDRSMFAHHHQSRQSWWWKNQSSDIPVSPKMVTPPSFPRGLRSKLVPNGTRNVCWLLERVFDVCGVSQEGRRGGKPRRTRNREKDRLMTGYAKKKNDTVLGSKLLGQAMAFVPTTPTSILAFLLCFGMFALGLTMTLIYILNPDKAALPWRQYCHSDYPTLYSLQHPSSSSEYDLFGHSSALTLAPLTHEHSAWPYHPHKEQPYSVESKSDLTQLEPVGILLGVFTIDSGVERRHMIRQSYGSHWRSRKEGTEGVRLRFVMGRPRAKYAKAVELEMEAFDDILLLDIPENMNSGKTHAFFSWAAANATVPHWEYPPVEERGNEPSVRPAPVWKGERRPQYVVKADDDSFIMLGELERRLRVAPRTKTYWGYLVKNLFMAGECYALSLDLVQYIADTPALRSMTVGKEDKLVSKWMNMHPEKESIVWATDKCWIYDHPKAGTVYSHGFLYPSEVAQVRHENATGLNPQILAMRGGKERADAYSTVSKFGTNYRQFHNDMTATERIEALVEGSSVSKIRDERISGQATLEPLPARVARLYGQRPSREERFMGDAEETGGTVVVHYIKQAEWFVETMIAMLGTADEQAVWRKGGGNGSGLLERRNGRVVGGSDGWASGLKVGKGAGL